MPLVVVMTLLSPALLLAGCQNKPKGEVEVIDDRWADIGLSPDTAVKTVWVDRQVVGDVGGQQGLWLKTTYIKPSLVAREGRLPAHMEEAYVAIDCKARKIYDTGMYTLYNSSGKMLVRKNSTRRSERAWPLDTTVLKLTRYVCGLPPAPKSASSSASSPTSVSSPATP